MTGYRLTPEQQAEMGALLADHAAMEEHDQAQLRQWRHNIARREQERALARLQSLANQPTNPDTRSRQHKQWRRRWRLR